MRKIGGSHPQRDIFHFVYIPTMIATGRYNDALTVLSTIYGKKKVIDIAFPPNSDKTIVNKHHSERGLLSREDSAPERTTRQDSTNRVTRRSRRIAPFIRNKGKQAKSSTFTIIGIILDNSGRVFHSR